MMTQKDTFSLTSKQRLELLILVGLCTLLLLFLILRPVGRFHWKLPELNELRKGDIERITWDSAGSSQILLQKEAGKWYLGEEKYPVKQSHVDTLLDQLSQPVFQDLVSKSGNLIAYDLHDEKVYELRAFKAGKSNPDEADRLLYVGKSSSSGRYSFVHLPDDQRVFTLGENINPILGNSEDDLRDRVVMSFAGPDIQKMSITVEDQNITVEKNEGKWQIPDDAVWDEDKVTRLVNRYANMNAQGFLNDFPAGVDTYELDFTDQNGVVYSVKIATESLEDGNYAAESSTYGFHFTLNSFTVESMLEDFGFISGDEE